LLSIAICTHLLSAMLQQFHDTFCVMGVCLPYVTML
jgi:hypothetical protein